MPSARSAGSDRLGEAGRLPVHQLAGAGPDPLEEVAGHEAAGRAHRDPGVDAPLQAGHPDHEELVEVGGEDRQELGPLQQGQGRVLGQLEHPLVERQPGQLAVGEAVGREGCGGVGPPAAAARGGSSTCSCVAMSVTTRPSSRTDHVGVLDCRPHPPVRVR